MAEVSLFRAFLGLLVVFLGFHGVIEASSLVMFTTLRRALWTTSIHAGLPT